LQVTRAAEALGYFQCPFGMKTRVGSIELKICAPGKIDGAVALSRLRVGAPGG
jgi:hypothetical protein